MRLTQVVLSVNFKLCPESMVDRQYLLLDCLEQDEVFPRISIATYSFAFILMYETDHVARQVIREYLKITESNDMFT